MPRKRKGLKKFISVGGPNWQDPEFQEAMLRQQQANPNMALAQSARGKVSREHAEEDMRRRLAFAKTGLAAQGFDINNIYQHNLIRERKRQRNADWDTFKWQLGFGGLGLAAQLGAQYAGQKERKKTEMQAKAMHQDRMEEMYKLRAIPKMKASGLRPEWTNYSTRGPYGLYGVLS